MNESNQAQRDYWRTRLAWVERQEQMDLQLGVFGLAAMEALGDISGTNVLDVGCGCGHTTLQLNERVGSGSVVGVDISEKLLEVARRRGSGAIEFIEADAQSHAPQGPYDIIFSRFGVMFFADPIAAFRNLRASTSEVAKLSMVCWQGPEQNPWMTVPNRAAMSLVDLPPRSPDAPDPFSFADSDWVREILEHAGWTNVDVADFRTEVKIGGGVNSRLAALHAYEFSPVKAVVDSDPGIRSDSVVDLMEAALTPHQQDGIVLLPGAAWIVTADN
ncbi:MAG: hypothetical protein CBD84_00710 [Acidimicrobiaceae bacterium TMED224]|nr:MAG: hypothetical protein CBD84_00710 [Acidimicrobiaceae bacterium TMED224]|tara:strand:+ start:1120 stop:1941 length:822 start_codon:yes stop_codon:yes gene_type:complete